jgi:hypothetical protein
MVETISRECFVRFVPSRVEGASDVSEAAVFATRFALKIGDRWQRFEFDSFAGRRRVVGNISFSRANYTDSFVRFHTEPSITIYMPVEGPRAYPDSHFWRLQQVVRGGGYELEDYRPGVPPPKPLPLRDRIILGTMIYPGMLNFLLFIVTHVYLGGSASQGKVEDGRHYVHLKGRYTQVSPDAFAFCQRVEKTLLYTIPFSFLGGILAAAWPRGDEPSGGPDGGAAKVSGG